MSSLTEFEKQHPAIGTTELWGLLKKRIEADDLSLDFLTSVGKVCNIGITLSKDIIRFFPTFTLHDETHIMNVCNWMVKLLGKRKSEVSAYDLALLVMSACCHDIGMSVSDNQAEDLRSNPDSYDWKQHFKYYLKDEEKFSKTGIISDQMLRNYIRVNHHKRISQQITQTDWPEELSQKGINRSALIELCASHGESLEKLNAARWQKYDLRFCAVMLRLADILDFDSSRAPIRLFNHLGLDNAENFEKKISQTEWAKNRSGVFGEIVEGVIPYTASFDSLQLELEVQSYLDWVQEELDNSNEYLSKYVGKWQDFDLPRKISTESVERNGYRYGKFCLTMDQDRVLELLTGRNLYSDPGVFVRELLQNAIDAVLTRSKLDPNFNENDGKIVISSWMDYDGNSWFRIEDNGIGMDENIITNYFLKVGRSYYSSDEFKADKRRYARGDDYTPISRFGIGVLSCFMSDPENNKLEVSTKRYSQDCMDDNPAIRMNVTGLHGYYYLAQEKEQDQYDEFFQPMHNPENVVEGYRREVGTTICVRVNLFQLGDYRNFKEILDKYVHFPEVNVEYHGPEGTVIYPKQNDLMEAVYKLNPNGPEKNIEKHTYAITDEQFEKLQSKMPETKWIERPTISFEYYPLDWLSQSENIKGIAVMVSLDTSVEKQSFEYKGQTVFSDFEYKINNEPEKRMICLEFKHIFASIRDEIELIRRTNYNTHYNTSVLEDIIISEYEMYNHDNNWISSISKQFDVTPKEIKKKYKELKKNRLEFINNNRIVERYEKLTQPSNIYISYDELFKFVGQEEGKALKYLMQSLNFTHSLFTENKSITVSAYNGVLADSSNVLGKSYNCLGILILLRGSYCPEVNLARDTINNLPLEAACNLSILGHELNSVFSFYNYSNNSKIFNSERLALLSEESLYKLLEKHPEWVSRMSFNNKTLEELKNKLQTSDKFEIGDFHKNFFYDYLRIAALKHDFTLCRELTGFSHPYVIAHNKETTNKFPVALFFMSQNQDYLFGRISSYYINYYNQNHRFSRWLIQHQYDLQSKVPGIYNTLLETMIKSKDKFEVLEAVNNTLTRLKNYNNNFFEVSDELMIKIDELK
ncbi:MAG: ATP-binding protein [Clostridia bacterium]|nr:ATP-binding protein [Clostridia bacterium]